MKGMFVLYLSLALGYVLCVVGKKQEGILRTLGYTLGAAIIILSLISGVLSSDKGHSIGWKKQCMPGMMSKMSCPMMKK